MALFPIIILALIQGLTEFLPISSSGHLVLGNAALGSDLDMSKHLVLNVAVHVGTLFSVLLYFRKDVWHMVCGLKNIAKRDIQSPNSKLLIHVGIASIPVIIAGLIIEITKPEWLLLLNVVAITTLVFGILLWIADKKNVTQKTLENLNIKDALIIGLAQSIALIPGTSRSGITMTAGRFLGYSRTQSAHFSLLLAIVAISGAGLLGSLELIKSGDATLGLESSLALIISFVIGWASIAVMMKWIEKIGFAPFAIYRIILGLALLYFINKDWLHALIL